MKNQHLKTLKIPIAALIFLLAQILPAQEKTFSAEEFYNPPESARPRTWWHWTNGNITKEGITKDLEWMKRAGIGGFQLADVASGQGQDVEKKIFFGTPEWLDALHHAASEADRLGLEMAIFSSPGWSLTGGPWVKPEQAMKKLVWSELNVKGPLNFSSKLPDPPSNEGPIRNMSRSAKISENEPRFYRDCLILAFPTPPDETFSQQAIPAVMSGAGPVKPAALFDDDLNTAVTIRAVKGSKTVWINFDFGTPFTARAITLASRAGIPVGTLSYSINGKDYITLAVLPGAQLYRAGKVETISFPTTTARYFRLEFTGAPMRPADIMSEATTAPDTAYNFCEIKFHSCARIHRWEDKAGFYHLFSYDPVESPSVDPSSAIDPSKVINLTPLLQPDGSLRWNIPPGNWTIMRFGYSLTGSRNRPAVPAGTGYEVDKLSRDHTEAYINQYTGMLKEALGDLYGKALRYVLLDSWEAGMQNWTDNMLTEFRKRRGYDLTPYLPCLAGRIVGNSSISDRFLWDFRRTLADMFAENHYGVITEYLHKYGIKTYGEASGVSLEILEDALLCKKNVDIPMGEFWYRALHPELMYYQDVRGAASAAHIYGKNIVAAESFTGGGYESPNTLKTIADYWFTQGINRIVFHTSAHQPLDTKPGNTMVGTHINRNITWGELAKPFNDYLARVSYMLQQGTFVADLLYLLDEGAPSTMPIWGTGLKPVPPDGYDYDYINAEALINRLNVSSDGRLVLPDGTSYSVLILPETRKMTLPVLRKIRELVLAGATVIGPRPEQTPGLAEYPESEKVLKNIAMEIWGDLDGISRTRRTAGKGRVFYGTPLKNVLEIRDIKPDVEYDRPLDTEINWIHRRTGDSDIYFIVNSSDKPCEINVSFRVSGMEPEKWDPVNGETGPAGYFVTGNRTVVPLSLEGKQSTFIVFRNKTERNERVIEEPPATLMAVLSGPWEVTFPAGLGAPGKITLDTLYSLSLHNDDGVKYFSGTATYRTTFKVPGRWLKNNPLLLLDPGKVCDIAEVSVNGSPYEVIWTRPYAANITGLLRKGINTIEIKVTNQWTNRLAGDAKLPPDKKVLKSQIFVRPGIINESGLIGPVRIIRISE